MGAWSDVYPHVSASTREAVHTLVDEMSPLTRGSLCSFRAGIRALALYFDDREPCVYTLAVRALAVANASEPPTAEIDRKWVARVRELLED